MNPYAIVAVIAIASLAVVEVSIAYQKYQLKKQFLVDLDRKGSEDTSQ